MLIADLNVIRVMTILYMISCVFLLYKLMRTLYCELIIPNLLKVNSLCIVLRYCWNISNQKRKLCEANKEMHSWGKKTYKFMNNYYDFWTNYLLISMYCIFCPHFGLYTQQVHTVRVYRVEENTFFKKTIIGE